MIPFLAIVLLAYSWTILAEVELIALSPQYCELHKRYCEKEIVPIHYGKPDMRSWKTERELFPHANLSVSGGCCEEIFSRRREAVRYCPECRKASDEWLAARERENRKGE